MTLNSPWLSDEFTRVSSTLRTSSHLTQCCIVLLLSLLARTRRRRRSKKKHHLQVTHPPAGPVWRGRCRSCLTIVLWFPSWPSLFLPRPDNCHTDDEESLARLRQKEQSTHPSDQCNDYSIRLLINSVVSENVASDIKNLFHRISSSISER